MPNNGDLHPKANDNRDIIPFVTTFYNNYTNKYIVSHANKKITDFEDTKLTSIFQKKTTFFTQTTDNS